MGHLYYVGLVERFYKPFFNIQGGLLWLTVFVVVVLVAAVALVVSMLGVVVSVCDVNFWPSV